MKNSGQLQNNAIIGAMSITINRVIISLMNSFTLLKLQIPTIMYIPTIITIFANNIHNLKHLLEHESSVGIKWFKDNKMIVKRGKFQGIVLEKKEKQSYTRNNQN